MIAEPQHKYAVRTCVACGERDAQSALLRLQPRENGELEVVTRKKDGRSAYLHRSPSCKQEFVSGNGRRLARSLRGSYGLVVRKRLIHLIEKDERRDGASTTDV